MVNCEMSSVSSEKFIVGEGIRMAAVNRAEGEQVERDIFDFDSIDKHR